MNRPIVTFSLMAMLCLTFSSQGRSQDILEQVYGSGVHAFFAGKLELAQELFDEVINAGSQDPRVYYFRGLTQVQGQCGIVEAGLADFEQAAQLEVSAKTSANVSRALERIQGPTRIAIERIRAKARLMARTLQVEDARARYGDQPELSVPAIPAPSPTDLPPPATDAPATSPSDDPFATGNGLTGGEPTPMPSGPTEPATPDFPAPSDTPSPSEPAAPSSDVNPFGDEPPAANPPATPDANPFGF
ncbi:MAG: hypothetical protein ACK53L_35285 [Pirellulaceae bacterium]